MADDPTSFDPARDEVSVTNAGAFEAPASGEVRGAPDKGSPRAARIAWVLSLLLIVIVVVMNQYGDKLAPASKKEEAQQSLAVPDDDPFGIVAKVYEKLAHIEEGMSATDRANIFNSFARQSPAQEPEDQIREAIVAGDLVNKDKALKLLKKVGHVDDHAEHARAVRIEKDLHLVTAVYEDGAQSLSPEEQSDLRDRYGWFGRLALLSDTPDSDPEKAALMAGGGRLFATLIGAALVGLIAIIGGIVAFSIMMVKIANGAIRPAFVPPAPGGSVYIETVGVFVAAFLLLYIAVFIIKMIFKLDEDALLPIKRGMQWLLILTPLYPLLRGVSFSEWRQQIGWHSGRGFWREVGAGIFGYFAMLPVLAIVMLITVGIVLLKEVLARARGEKPTPPQNHIADLLGHGTTLEIILLFTLASMWAPLVEESIFRGALFRQMRTRRGVIFAALGSGVCFGAMHGYEGLLLLPVITIGICFAFIRNWRGSLIPTATAHALHNGMLLVAVLSVLSALQ